ncbi:Protein gts1 [Pyricularia oryzae]
MSGAQSKRQAARNEKVLQELVQGVPGNNLCADCHSRNPAWASWSLGVFLCMRCAAIHRKLGTHISKVKSLSMDSWSNEQVDNMRKVGNATSNKIYNPQNKKPPVPIDADEADSAMERFIRQKYMNNSVASARRHNTGSTESDETPPPLPPKTPSRFGFRSASSIFPLSSKAKKDIDSSRRPPPSPRSFDDRATPVSPRGRPSKPFGASVQHDDQDGMEHKLMRLRDMGFIDEQRNSMVLRGMGGNLEKTIEALVRLGEGSAGLSVARETVTPLKRSLTPSSSHLGVPQSATSPSGSSTNPFDMLDMPPAQPQSSQSTGTLQNKNPYNNNNTSTNPFGVPTQQSYGFEQALQNMSLSASPQPQSLFPNHTGGVSAYNQGQQQQQQDYNPFHQMQQSPQAYQQQQAVNGQMPQMPQNAAPTVFNSNQTYPPMTQQPMPTGSNPFFQHQQQQQQQPSSLSVNTAVGMGQFAGNPFMAKSPTRVQSPTTLTQIPEQTQQNFYHSATATQAPWGSQAPAMLYSTPLSAPVQSQSNNPFYVPQQQPQQQNMAPRPDTASIMALYNSSPAQPASNPYQQQQQQHSNQGSNMPLTTSPGQFQQQLQQNPHNFTPQAPARSMTTPALSSGTKNPFMSMAGGAAEVTAPSGARSRDSVLAQGLEWTNGRHSPDAFASLSART